MGDLFHLSTVKEAPYAVLSERAADPDTWETHDVMLSGAVTVEQYNKHEIDTLNAQAKELRRGGCFRVNGKIVI